MCPEIWILSLSFLFIIFLKIRNKNPPAIFNVYQQPNGLFYLKAIFMFTIISLRRLKTLFKAPNLADLDQIHPLSQNPKAIDAVYFNGANKNGDHLVVGTARRRNRLVDGFFYLLIQDSNLGLLESPKLPSTSLYKTEDVEEWAVEGIRLTPIAPMKKWKITYESTMKRAKHRDETVSVRIDAEWTSNLPIFNFDSDMDPWTIAKGMAHEKFSREFFKSLERTHQTHYEQFGDLVGTATIDGKEYRINMDTVRDHSFGEQRDWRIFHRYGLHFFSAENGDRFQVGAICAPIALSNMTLGYVYCAEDKKNHPVTSTDFKLYQHGEDGDPPRDYAFSFTAGGRNYVLKVKVVHSPHFYISKDWECKVVERLCKFEVNGVKGWGAAEWEYRNIREKNVSDYTE